MKVRVRFIELGEKLRVILDEQYDLTAGSALPAVGDSVHIYDTKRNRTAQFWVVERHWNIGNIIGMIEIFLSPTSEQAKTI